MIMQMWSVQCVMLKQIIKYCDECGQKLDWSGEIVGENVFCEHDYRILADYQQTSAKSKKTTNYVIAKCIKCGKEQRLLEKGFGKTIGGVTDETDRCK